MGRPRKHNKHLPARWVKAHGAIYYMVPPGQEDRWDGKKKFRLGKNEAEAYRAWAERIDPDRGNIHTVAQLLDRYMAEHVPTLKPATRRDYTKRVAPLRVYFGGMAVDSVEPHHVYDYIRIRSKSSPRGAALDKKVLQHAYSKAAEWGVTKRPNPCAGIRTKTARSKRYVEDWELDCMYSVCNPMLQAFINVAMATGMRKKDILELKLADLKRPDGIQFHTSKTDAGILVQWSPVLSEAIQQAQAVRRRVGSLYLFANRDGQSYVAEDAQTSGFDSQWQRAMKKALQDTALTKSFTAHNLRAKVASDTDAGHAQRLLGHTNPATTAGYRRKPEAVAAHNRNK